MRNILTLVCPKCGLENRVVEGKIIAIGCKKCGTKIYVKVAPPKPKESTTVKKQEEKKKPIKKRRRWG